MEFKFIDTNWSDIFEGISRRNTKEYKFVTPFIQLKTIKSLLKKKTRIKLITRYDLNDFYNGVSSLDALEYILRNGGKIKGIKKLHSKLYIFDSKEAILASANLTQAALLSNYEFGMHTVNANALSSLDDYFDSLWDKVPDILKQGQIDQWREQIDTALQEGKHVYRGSKLKDFGFSVDKKEKIYNRANKSKTIKEQQYFVKFFGEGHNRGNKNMSVFEEVKRSGSHWACTYPTNKVPRSVQDGAILFMGRIVSDPNDIMIYGYALGNKYKEKRDDATAIDIEVRPFKEHWSRYIRVHDARLINGKLKDGVSLNMLMTKFGYRSFVSTMKHHEAGTGNTNPRKAYNQQAAVQLTHESAEWLMGKVKNKLEYNGEIAASELLQIESNEIRTRMEKIKSDNVCKEARDYLKFWEKVDIVVKLIKDLSREEWPEVPVYLTVDHFWHWIKVEWDKKNIKKIQGDLQYREKEIPQLFKQYIHYDKKGPNWTKTMLQASKRLKFLLGRKRINKLSKEEAEEVYRSLHSGNSRAVRFSADKKFTEENGINKIRKSLEYLLFSEDQITEKIHKLINDPKYKLSEFGPSNIQELIGWTSPQKMPLRNRKADYAVEILGYKFK